MPPLNITAWLSSVLQSVPDVKTIQQIQENTFYSPKKTFSDNTIAYYLYCQPIFIVLLVIWMIVSMNLVWIGNHKKIFGLMTAYTSLDIAALLVQNIALITVFSTKDNYLKYELCYVYELSFTFIPMCLRTISQWLKVGQTLTVFIMLYKPLTFKIIVSTKARVLFITLSVFVSCSISVVYYVINVKFEKTIALDKTTKEAHEVCREVSVYTDDNKTNRNAEFIITITNDIVQQIIPGILMICLFIGIHRLLKKQVKTRKSLHIESTERERSDERLSKVTMIATIISVLFAIPETALTILVNTDFPFVEAVNIILEVIGTISRILLVLSIPINFLLFSWLNGQFRNRVLTILKRLHTCISC
ncbi:unnamed protein product [Mytilus coruscus]|uniref:G-protein coupled receptors family 1 profile domain-containing protein n=1 Tax=Mytilus coruscus TaxID=42192 RepID=A0A6J8D014_MYTCO|nr:unnamed protein product [Mytilus coruscus]